MESCCNVTNAAVLQRKARVVFRKLFVLTSAKINKRLKLFIYNPPRSNKVEFVNMMDKFLDNLRSSNKPVIFRGDMNLDIMKNNLLSRNYLNSFTANGFCISSPEPTRSTNEYSSCLDHFIYQNLDKQVSVEGLKHQNFTDHNPFVLTWRANEDINKIDLMLRDNSFVNNKDAVSRYKMALEAYLNKNSDIIYKSFDPCDAFSTFNQLFLKMTENFAPLKSVDNKQKIPKWFDNRLKNLRQKRNHTYYKYRENKNNHELLKKIKDCRIRLERQLKLRII